MISRDDDRFTTHEFAGNLPSLESLRSFVVVAEEASFTRAAARVHVAQPGVSAQVRRLEAELGQQLLDRSARSVRLTEVGAAVLPFARAALQAVSNARLAVDQLAGLVRGQVAVGMVSGCSVQILPGLLAEFHDHYPGVGIALSEDASDRLVEFLRDGRLDLALIGSAGGAIPGLEAAVVADEALVAAVSAADPLATRAAVTLEDLRDLPLVSLPRGTGVRGALDAACADAGFEPRIAFEASAPPMVARLAGMGLGVAVLPASIPPSLNLPLHILAIERPRLRSRLELAWNPAASASPAARVLVEHARAFLRRTHEHRDPAA
jgi:DNA-binding transcriptional LysR family regulator